METKELNKIEIGGIYLHFKGQKYKVLALAQDSENHDRKLVVYQALYGEELVWVRELEMFLSKVDKQKYPEVVQVYRFELIK